MIVTGVRTLVRSALIASFAVAGVVVAEVTAGPGGGSGVIDAEARAARVHGAHGARSNARDAQHEEAVWTAVARFANRMTALEHGYEACGECGGGGRYYVDAREARLDDPTLTPEAPYVLWYERLAEGRSALVAVKYAVSVDAWRDAGNDGPPTLLGRSFARDDDFLDEPVYLLVVPAERTYPAGGLLE